MHRTIFSAFSFDRANDSRALSISALDVLLLSAAGIALLAHLLLLQSSVSSFAAIVLGALTLLLAVRFVQLMQSTRSRVSEQRELARLRALIEVNRALAGAGDLNVTLRTVTEWACRVLRARSAVIELLSEDGLRLELRAATGLPPDVIGLTYDVGRSFTGSVVQERGVRVSVNAARDPAFAPQSSFIGEQAVAAVPLVFRERVLGVLACMGPRPFEPADIEMLSAFANQAALAIEDARLIDQVRILSITDALTGLANRRRLDRDLEREFAAARRGRRLVAVMFDLDDFKQHNDRYGHLAGDRALRHFADALKAETRAMNLAARYGGDEFFVLLGDADRKGAQTFVERVTLRFARIMEAVGSQGIGVSAGMAEFQPDMSSPAELVEAADRALYNAKSEEGASR